jgi:hypothetical protein
MRHLTKLLGMAAFVFSCATGAHAAPQILGVIPTTQPLKLHCADNRCQVQVPTLCLEAKRKPPIGGHIYKPVDSSVFSVVARNGAGKTVHLPLRDAVFRVTGGYAASQVVLATSGMRSRGLTPVALTVAAGTILIPKPVPGDTDPITRAEIKRVKHSLWPKAKRVLKKRRQQFEAIGIVNRLLNETPVVGLMTAAARKDLWRNTFGKPSWAAAGKAKGLAVGALVVCQRKVAKGMTSACASASKTASAIC